MRLGYFGDGPWAHRAFDAIRARAELEIAFVVTRHEAPDPELRRRAAAAGLPSWIDPDVNAPAHVAKVAEHGCDVLVSMSFAQILRRPILDVAPLGFLNCHAGALPFYRGRSPLNWAILNGEERFGVTVHHVDEGVDTGDIVLQRFGPIGPDDGYGVVLERAYGLCADTLVEALLLLARGERPRIPQASIHPVGLYGTRRRPGDEVLDWGQPEKRVHDFVRGVSPPGPGARTEVDGRTLAILRTERIDGAPDYVGIPGEVVGRDARGIVVKTADRTIRVTSIADVRPDGTLGPTRVPRAKIGTRFARDADRIELERLRRRLEELERG